MQNLRMTLVSAVVLSTAALVPTAEARQFETFKDYCNHRADLAPDVEQTVQAILDNLFVTWDGPQSPVDWDCNAAVSRLAETQSLSLLDRSDTFFPRVTTVNGLEPLETLQGLTELTVGGSMDAIERVYDIAGFANLVHLKKLDLRFGSMANVESLGYLPFLEELRISAWSLPELWRFRALKKITINAENGDEIYFGKLSTLPSRIESLLFSGSGFVQGMPPHFGTDQLASLDVALFRDKLSLTTLNLSNVNLVNGQDLKELLGLTSLTLQNLASGALDVSGLPSLATIKVQNSQLTGYDTFGAVPSLKSLTLNDAGLANVDFASTLTALEYLDVERNVLNSVAGLRNLPALKELHAANNHLAALVDLGLLTSLQVLNLNSNDIMSLFYLSNLSELVSLEAGNNQIYSLVGTEHMAKLQRLNLANNQLYSLHGLEGLQSLTALELAGNRLSDVRVLEDLPALHGLQNLDLSHNKILSTRGLKAFTALKTLSLYDNSVGDLQDLAGLTSLEHLELSYNNVSDVAPLTTLTNLAYLDIGQNRIVDVSPLATLTNIRYLLNLGDNQITDASPLLVLANQGFRLILSGNPLIAQVCPVGASCEF